VTTEWNSVPLRYVAIMTLFRRTKHSDCRCNSHCLDNYSHSRTIHQCAHRCASAITRQGERQLIDLPAATIGNFPCN